MIFFPILFPDEILYSAFARYHRDSGNENYKRTMEDLFGEATVCASLLFPSHLDQLCERMPIGSTLTPEQLIVEHTFLPYFTPFLPKPRKTEMFKIMRSDKGTALYMQLGRPASTIRTHRSMVYCPKCVIDDRGKYGEAYWHRSHQADGVYFCHAHVVPLIFSNASYSAQRNKHEFITLETALRSEYIEINYYDPILLDKQQFIANQTNILFNLNLKPFELDEIKQFYLSRLQHMGLANHTGRIKWAELILAFNQHYSKQLLVDLYSYVQLGQEATWIHKLLRKPRVTCHPLRHILVLGFLGETVESMANIISNKSNQYYPFGKGPWPCLNKAANHYNDPVISSCEITSCSETGQPVGTFSCSCGFVYSRKGPDQSIDDHFKIGRIKRFGEVWDEKLRVISQQNIPLREMARLLGCDPKTVISRTSNSQTAKTSPVDQDSMRYKEVWNKLMESNSSLSITEFRKLNPAAFSWLYRHDREWLQEHSPGNIKSTIKRERINWEERDHHIAEEVRLAAIDILNGKSDKLIRITKAEIGRRIGKTPLIFKMLHKLPETAKRLNVVVETVEQFQVRRINLRALELKKANEVVKRWELIRASGLKENFIEIHRDVIDVLTVT